MAASAVTGVGPDDRCGRCHSSPVAVACPPERNDHCRASVIDHVHSREHRLEVDDRRLEAAGRIPGHACRRWKSELYDDDHATGPARLGDDD